MSQYIHLHNFPNWVATDAEMEGGKSAKIEIIVLECK
jgi:hypothetical protein